MPLNQILGRITGQVGRVDAASGSAQDPLATAPDETYQLPPWASKLCKFLVFSLLVPLTFWAAAAGVWRALDTGVQQLKFAVVVGKNAWPLVGASLFYAAGALGAVVLVFMGAAVVGSAFGFLFGLPRMEPLGAGAVEQERMTANGAHARISGDPPQAEAGELVTNQRPPAATEASPRAELSTTRTGFRMSPALNEIADWLTKIIVGLGLVESDKIAAGFTSTARFFLVNGGMGRFPAAGVVVPASMVIGLVSGFILTYLVMILLLGPQLARAANDLETAAESEAAKRRLRQWAEMEKTRRADAEAEAGAIARDARERAAEVDRWRKYDIIDLLSTRPDHRDPDVSEAARRFAQLEFADCATNDEKLAWAKINVALGRREQALTAYQAEADRPGVGFKFLQEGYVLAERLGDKNTAVRFRAKVEAFQEARPDTVAPLDQARFELSKIEQDLYRAPPEGFEAAIAGLEDLERRMPRVAEDPSFHVFFAAALGQKYAAQKAAQADETILKDCADEALRHIFKARVAGETEWLRYLADPEKGGKDVPPNNDLVELAKRPDVKQALGMM